MTIYIPPSEFTYFLLGGVFFIRGQDYDCANFGKLARAGTAVPVYKRKTSLSHKVRLAKNIHPLER